MFRKFLKKYMNRDRELLETNLTLYFQQAVSNGESRKAQKALEKGVNINMQDKRGETSLMYALRSGRIKLFQTLLQHFPNVRVQNKKGQNILFVAIEENYPEYILPILKQNPTVINERCQGITPLIYAIKQNNLNAFRMLIRGHANVNKTDLNGKTPLMYAALNNNHKMINSLLNADADLNAKDENGQSVIDLMRQAGNESLCNYFECRLLLQELSFSGPDIFIQDGHTPLTWAIEHQKTALVRTLIEIGAQIDLKDKNGRTALNLAYEKNDTILIDMLQRAKNREKKLLEEVQKRLENDEKDLWKGFKITSLTEKQKILKMISENKKNSSVLDIYELQNNACRYKQ